MNTGTNADLVDMGSTQNAKERIQSLIRKPFRVSLSDGRIIVGLFECLDQYQNIILRDSIEFRSLLGKEINQHNLAASASGEFRRRSLGMTMIPGNHILQCEAYP